MSRRLGLGLAAVALIAIVLIVRAVLSHDASARERQQPAAASAGPPAAGAPAPDKGPGGAGGAQPGAGQSGGGAAGGRGGPPSIVQVITAPVEHRDVPIWLEGLGTVSAWQQVTVKPQVDGILQSVQFREGQTVKAGDVLATIDPRPFLVQLHQAEGTLARDEGAVTNGKLNLERYRQLAQQKLIPIQQATDQEAVVTQAQGALKVDQAAIESARLNLDYARIKAPIDGIVGVRLIDAGNQVHTTDATGLVVITQLDPAGVMITIPQDNLPAILGAQSRGDVPVEVWSRDGAQKLGTGKIYALDNQINVATGTVRVKAQIANPQRLLWPNGFVKARILADTSKSAVVIPTPALQRGPQGTFVYLAQPDGTAVQKPVKVALTTGEISVISEGVSVGEQVVVEGQNQLRPGTKIAVRSAK